MVIFGQDKNARTKDKGQKILKFITQHKQVLDKVRKTALLSLVLILYMLMGGSVKAATLSAGASKTPAGITISPASQLVSVQSNEAQHPLQFSVTNNEPSPKTISISTADFNTLGESGGLVFVGTNPTQLEKKYGLATWLNIPQSTITVQPKQTTTFTVSIINQPSMAPGGHYGALLLQLAPSSSSQGQNQVAVHPIASSLLFVDKQGGDTHILGLSNVYASHSIFKLPGSVTLRFKNDGNTHLVPRGIVTITDPGGKVVEKGIINENSGIILPETYRRYSVPLSKIATPLHPGKYTLRVDFRFDGFSQFRSYQSSMFLVAPSALLVIAVVLAGLILALFLFKNFYTSLKKPVARRRSKRIDRRM